MPGIELLVDKLIKMKEYMEQLTKIKPGTYDEYASNLTARYAVERLIQLIVGLALDINNIILSYLKKPPAPDYFNSFIELGENNVLDRSFAAGIAPSTGLRNRLVHEYENTNNEIVYKNIDRFIEMYSKYMAFIAEYVKGK